MNDQQQTAIQSILNTNTLAVLSSLSKYDGSPQSALVAFAEDEDLNLYFQTRTQSRKYANVTHNNHVSFVIGWELADLRTLQYEGIAQAVDTASLSFIKKLFIQKDSPSTKEHLDHKDARFFTVTPSWIRYSDYSAIPPIVWEYHFV